MVEDAVGQIEHGSVHWVLEVFKPYGAGLVEEVNQVASIAIGSRTDADRKAGCRFD